MKLLEHKSWELEAIRSLSIKTENAKGLGKGGGKLKPRRESLKEKVKYE